MAPDDAFWERFDREFKESRRTLRALYEEFKDRYHYLSLKSDFGKLDTAEEAAAVDSLEKFWIERHVDAYLMANGVAPLSLGRGIAKRGVFLALYRSCRNQMFIALHDLA